MNFITNLKKLVLQPSVSDQYGLTDTEFFKRVLLVLPGHARIEFDQSEPGQWVEALQHWSYREDPEQYEADYYVIAPAFVTTLSNLVDSAPKTLDSCHHMSATDKDGSLLFSSLDNFCIMHFRKDLADALARFDSEHR